MANNRELSQFASFVSVDDTSDSISFASTITSVNVSGASTIGNVVIGAATTDIVVTGDLNVTGVISATQFGGEAVINTDRIIQVGGGTSITRASNLQAELDKLGKKTIGPGVAITIQLAAGEYFFTSPLKLRGEGTGITILGSSTSGTKPGDTGNHYYNQAGVPNGVNPATVGAGRSLCETLYDSTSPAGAYPNPMADGQLDTAAAKSYNEGIIETYYTSRLKFFNCSGILAAPNGSSYALKDLAIIGAGQTSLTTRSGVRTTEDSIVLNNVDTDSDGTPDEVEVQSVTRQQTGGKVILENVDVFNFYYGVIALDGGSIITRGSGTNLTCNTVAGAYSIRGSYIPLNSCKILSNGGWGVVATQQSIANPTNALIANNQYGIGCHSNSFVTATGMRVSNHKLTGIRATYGSNLLAQHCWVDDSALYGVYSLYNSTINVSKTRIANGGGTAMLAQYGGCIVGTGLTITQNQGTGARVSDGGIIRISNVGITTNGSYGALVQREGYIYIFGNSTSIYDNNGSSAGDGVAPTAIQVAALGSGRIALSNWGDAAGNRHSNPPALSPNLDTMGNGNALILDTGNTTFTGVGDTSYPRAVEAGT
jgi:hypothetical protein